MKKLVKLVFITAIINSLVLALLVPLWHFPDEQAHFGHVAYLAEGGDPLTHGRKDQNQEIVVSEEILGTKRNIKGNNKFTFHPEYRIDYSDTVTGPQEEYLKNLPQEYRKNFIIQESAYYPHFYYYLSGYIYKLFYQSNIFIRVFALRIFWLFVFWLMIWFIYQSAKLIFPQNNLAVLSITTFAAFQPMLSFVSAGITSDNLHNLLFTAVIYYCLKLLNKPQWPMLVGLFISLALGLVNKQQFLSAFLIVIPVIIYALLKNSKLFKKFIFITAFSVLFAYILAPHYFSAKIISPLLKGKLPYIKLGSSSRQLMPDYSLINHFRYTIIHTIKEVLPWYWGVFNWLGVVLPRWVNRVLMRLLAVSGLGLIIRFAQLIKVKKVTPQIKNLSLIIWFALAYFLALLIWDWSFFRFNSFPFGIQGRYYFPVILTHMVLLYLGLETIYKLLSRLINKPITNYLLLITSYWFIFLNWLSLKVIASSYYDLSDLKIFIIQASQYKPFFAKGMFLSGSLLAYLFLSIWLVISLFRYYKNYDLKTD